MTVLFPLWESQDVRMNLQEYFIFMTWKNLRIERPKFNFEGHKRPISVKPMKPSLSWNNWDERDL